MFDLFIGNKNYSSWSLRPWVLMRELNIPFRENLVPFGGAQSHPGVWPAEAVVRAWARSASAESKVPRCLL